MTPNLDYNMSEGFVVLMVFISPASIKLFKRHKLLSAHKYFVSIRPKVNLRGHEVAQNNQNNNKRNDLFAFDV